MNHTVTWIDGERPPKCQPDPRYPDGKDVDASHGAAKVCVVELHYPAKRVGLYSIKCDDCGLSAGVSTTGRPDDPRSVKLACLIMGEPQT
jgi:hypothetical protein